jgi:hypothetical protein
MKKLLYIFVALSTFSIGIAAFYFRPPIKPITLCEIKQNASLYDKQEVYFKAYLEVLELGDNEKVDYFDLVSSWEKGCISEASLEYSDKLKADKKLEKLRKQLHDDNLEIPKAESEKGRYLSEVEIIGEVDDLSNNGIKFSFTPGLSVKVKEIKQISSIRFISREEVSTFKKSK